MLHQGGARRTRLAIVLTLPQVKRVENMERKGTSKLDQSQSQEKLEVVEKVVPQPVSTNRQHPNLHIVNSCRWS